jgi:hypothetical protein
MFMATLYTDYTDLLPAAPDFPRRTFFVLPSRGRAYASTREMRGARTTDRELKSMSGIGLLNQKSLHLAIDLKSL